MKLVKFVSACWIAGALFSTTVYAEMKTVTLAVSGMT